MCPEKKHGMRAPAEICTWKNRTRGTLRVSWPYLMGLVGRPLQRCQCVRLCHGQILRESINISISRIQSHNKVYAMVKAVAPLTSSSHAKDMQGNPWKSTHKLSKITCSYFQYLKIITVPGVGRIYCTHAQVLIKQTFCNFRWAAKRRHVVQRRTAEGCDRAQTT